MRKIICIVSITLAVAVLIILGIWIFLPTYIENRILPDMIRKTGLSPTQIRVRHIGMWGADLGPLRVVGRDGAAIEIQAVQISYSPLSLWHKKIGAVVLAGAAVDLDIGDEAVCIAGRCWPRNSPEGPAGSEDDLALEKLLPIELDRFKVLQIIARLRWQNRRMDIPIDIDMTTDRMREGLLTGTLTCSPRGQNLTADFTVDSAANSAGFTLKAANVRVHHFSDFWESRLPLTIAATADVTAIGAIRIQPLAVTRLDIQAVMTPAQISGDGWELQGVTMADGRRGMAIQVTTESSGKWHLTCSPLEIITPVPLQWSAIQADILLESQGWQLTGSSRSLIPAQIPLVVPEITATRPLALEWQFQAFSKSSGELEFDITADARETAVLSYGPYQLEGRRLRAIASGRLINDTVEGQIAISTDALDGRLKVGRLQSKGFSLHAEATQKNIIKSRFEFKEPVFTSDALSARAPMIVAETHIEKNQQDSFWRIASHVRLEKGLLQDRDLGLAISDIALDMPLQWPLAGQGQNGRVSAAAIRWRTHEMGAVSGALFQQSRMLKAEMIHNSLLLPGLRLHLKAALDREGARLNLNVPDYRPDHDIDLSRFITSAPGFLANGRLSAQAEMVLTGQTMKGKANMAIVDGRLAQKDNAIDLGGISGALAFNDLPSLRSEPGQPFSVARLRIGTIAAEELQARIQIEPSGTLFIEQAELKWCRGILNTQTIRIQPDMEELAATLFCSQLNLAEILVQLGVAQGSGQGTVNGRIPLRWGKGLPTFDNGFLYSTPGETGTIRLRDTHSLLQGIPRDTPQYVQLDIATEALKDYTYNWAKVNLDSQGDILKMSLKLDGRPNQALPFAYDQNKGQFLRIQGQGQAEFKGINIDLNFQIPLNQILQYKDLLTPKE